MCINLLFSTFFTKLKCNSLFGTPADLCDGTLREENICTSDCEVDRKCVFLLLAEERNLIRFM